MKLVIWTLPCVIAAVSWGCAGEIENPEDFREARGAVTGSDAGDGKAGRGAAGRSWAGAGGAGAGASAAGAGAPAGTGAADGGAEPEDDAGVPEPAAGRGAAGGGAGGGNAAGAGAAGGGSGVGGAAGGGAAGRGAAGGGSTMMPPPPSCDFRGLVMMKCAGASCHGGPTASTGLDLTSPSLAMRVAARTGSGACSDKLMVDKDNPAESALYLRVTGSECGVRMPLGGTLTPTEQACFLSWIEGL